MKKVLNSLIILSLVILVGAGVYAGLFLLEGSPPVISKEKVPKILGRDSRVSFKVEDDKSGIRAVYAELEQNGKSVLLGSKSVPVPEWWKGSGVKELEVSWNVRPLAEGLKDGKAILKIRAYDASLRRGLKGNESIMEIPITIDLSPPRIIPVSTVHNISTGGSGLVSFRVNEDVEKAGVWVGKLFFPAYKLTDAGQDAFAAMIALPFNAKKSIPVRIEAVDKAGNSAKSIVSCRIMKKQPRVDRIRITDGFLERKMPDFMARYPDLKGSLLQVFLEVNTRMRQDDNDQIRKICSAGAGSPQIMWHGAFKRMPGALRAGFADYRHYFYKGKEIGQAYHMGVDIASVAHAPVPAANEGQVVFADYLGIYGNTIIIDHGLGLFSMYSHLSAMRVSKGDRVRKGDTIGNTDMTGLAGGDHLHYGMLVNGVFVNPKEWWDKRWIKDHITANLPGSSTDD